MAPGLCSACALSSIPKGAGSSSGPKSTATASLLLSPPKQILIHQLDALLIGRPTLEDLRQDLRAVTKKCRPDWDITTPELKAAWQQGRKELFYPYGNTYAQTLGEQD